MNVILPNIQCKTLTIHTLNMFSIFTNMCSKVKVEMCLEKCLIPNHSFYSVLYVNVVEWTNK